MDGTQLLDVPAGLIESGPDVYAFEAERLPVVLGSEHLAFLRERAARSPRLRSRICMHRPNDAVHEMLIVHHRTVYVRPHRHARKSESLAVIEGEARVIFFDDDGAVRKALALGVPTAAERFFYRIPAGTWHALAIDSEWFVFHEVVAGPFVRSETEFPAWAPDGDDPRASAEYLERLRREISR